MTTILILLLSLYLAAECAFYAIYRRFLLPRAEKRRHDGCLAEYRDYGPPDRRHALMLRILNRMERTCRATGEPLMEVLKSFLRNWFVEVEPSSAIVGGDDDDDDASSMAKGEERKEEREERRRTVERQSSSSSSLQAIVRSSGDEGDDDAEFLRKDDMDRFFSWAFFDKDRANLTTDEQTELDVLHSVVRDRLDLTFRPGKTPGLEPMRLTLDPINAVHRPLIVYVAFALLGLLGRIYLRAVGFDRYATRSGLTYWYRAPRTSRLDSATGGDSALPLLFFHGIAPGGLALYVPILLWGLIRGDGATRPVFLFETRPISFTLTMDCLTEEDTVRGVSEALGRHLDDGRRSGEKATTAPVAVAGHSFGSCQITWLLRCPSLSSRIKQVVLLDPVSILLSEPDVMINFLYKRSYLDGGGTNKIGVVANEVGVEHYLRRNFAWYNSELWLEDVPSWTKVLVCLSELDEIVPSRKVKREIEMRKGGGGGDETTKGDGGCGSAAGGGGDNVELIHWKGVGHGHCITSWKCWEDVRNAMRRQAQTGEGGKAEEGTAASKAVDRRRCRPPDFGRARDLLLKLWLLIRWLRLRAADLRARAIARAHRGDIYASEERNLRKEVSL